jgi:hypothetical protein
MGWDEGNHEGKKPCKLKQSKFNCKQTVTHYQTQIEKKN